MTRPIEPTAKQVEWLKEHRNLPPREIARYLGVCTDTAIRIMVRLDLYDADEWGAKYQASRRREAATWTRPCSRCGCTKPRPRWQFRCARCHERERE